MPKILYLACSNMTGLREYRPFSKLTEKVQYVTQYLIPVTVYSKRGSTMVRMVLASSRRQENNKVVSFFVKIPSIPDSTYNRIPLRYWISISKQSLSLKQQKSILIVVAVPWLSETQVQQKNYVVSNFVNNPSYST